MSVSSRSVLKRPDARTVVTIEARMTSSRLPGKVLAEVGGRPMLALMVSRLRECQTIDDICVATTINATDDPIAVLAEQLGVFCFRGSEEDVLERVLGAAHHSRADVIVETTGDCPLIDPGVLDACVFAYLATDVHYCGNHLEQTFPRGLDVKVFATDVLDEVAGLTQDPADHEHVSLYIYEHPERYDIVNVPAPAPMARPDWRWTVDEAEDLEFVRAVVDAVGPSCSARRICAWLDEHPEIVAINGHIAQKAVR